jgi:hypothetical protein
MSPDGFEEDLARSYDLNRLPFDAEPNGTLGHVDVDRAGMPMPERMAL